MELNVIGGGHYNAKIKCRDDCTGESWSQEFKIEGFNEFLDVLIVTDRNGMNNHISNLSNRYGNRWESLSETKEYRQQILDMVDASVYCKKS